MLDPSTYSILRGLDDLAHNRLFNFPEWHKVKNYGKRRKKYKCYCKEIARQTKEAKAMVKALKRPFVGVTHVKRR